MNTTVKPANGKNGTATEQPKDKTVLTVSHNAEAAKEVKPETKRERQIKTLKDILEKNAKIQRLLDQHEKLNQTTKKLDSFKLGSDRLADTLSIEDGDGNEFHTNNTDIIEKVVNLIKSEVELKTDELEKQITAAEAA